MSKRRTSPAERLPQTKDEAIPLLERYAVLSARIDGRAAAAVELLAEVKAEAAAAIAPLEAERKALEKVLKPWFAGSIDELTGGKRKSIELAGCTFGYRMSPPKVHFAGGPDDVAAAALIGAGLGEALVRTSHAPDKPALLRTLEGEDTDAIAGLQALGFSRRQTESFFIDVDEVTA